MYDCVFICSEWTCPLPGRGFPGGADGEESACSAGDPGSNPGLGRSPGGGNGNPRQYSSLENLMDGGAWQATVHGVTKIRTWLNDFTFLSFFLPGRRLGQRNSLTLRNQDIGSSSFRNKHPRCSSHCYSDELKYPGRFQYAHNRHMGKGRKLFLQYRYIEWFVVLGSANCSHFFLKRGSNRNIEIRIVCNTQIKKKKKNQWHQIQLFPKVHIDIFLNNKFNIGAWSR